MIPKIVHQIWIGNNKRPDIWIDTVRAFCEKFGYEHKLWDEDAIDAFKLQNGRRYRTASCYAGKADIVRYEVVHRFGGVYMDADCVVVNPEGLDALIQNFDGVFAAGREPNAHFEDHREFFERRKLSFLVANSVFFAQPKSKLLAACINAIAVRRPHPQVIAASGPVLLTEMYLQSTEKRQITLFPEHVFYPEPWCGITDIDRHVGKKFSPETVLFQYGYSTNNLKEKL